MANESESERENGVEGVGGDMRAGRVTVIDDQNQTQPPGIQQEKREHQGIGRH